MDYQPSTTRHHPPMRKERIPRDGHKSVPVMFRLTDDGLWCVRLSPALEVIAQQLPGDDDPAYFRGAGAHIPEFLVKVMA
jgi:hypothetical protein